MEYINDWNDVPVGSKVIEDTYNEVYEVFMKNDERWLRQVGWQVANNKPVPELERPADFSPNCTYDQPWLIYDGSPNSFLPD